MQAEDPKLCPSATCSKTASLLGVVQENKTVRLLDSPLELNDEFIKRELGHGEPERRFRFADKCVKHGCKQWTGSSCGVMNELSTLNPSIVSDEAHLPKCFIRRTCRWYSQEGGRACKICLFVVTESREDETLMH
jgi:hypothetical protein